MDKNQAEQEILRRICLSVNELHESFRNYFSKRQLLDYDDGELSKQELIKMITLDEDGNLLSEPDYTKNKNGELVYGGDIEYIWEYQQAFNQATEIVNCYDGE